MFSLVAEAACDNYFNDFFGHRILLETVCSVSERFYSYDRKSTKLFVSVYEFCVSKAGLGL